MDTLSTSELTPHELLKYMEVPGQPRVYLLGCLDKRVTLYSQQTRALNLVYALTVTGRLAAGAKIAVIGGGVAGLTAAAGAALKGYRVTLLEQDRHLLHLLLGSDKRWLHPRVYDWPARDSLRDDTEDLGVLTWRADTADRVARQILTGWESVKASTDGRVREVTRALDVTLLPGSGTTRTITWQDPGYQTDEFDAVLIAVGFGVERTLSPVPPRSYWDDDALTKSDRGVDRRVFISGTGDGGLTDLLRACIDDFRHEKMVREFGLDELDDPRVAALARRLARIEDECERIEVDGGDSSKHVTESYRGLDDPSDALVAALIRGVDDALKKRSREGRTIILNGPEHWPVSRLASKLNRLLVARALAVGMVRYWSGKLESSAIQRAGNAWHIKLPSGRSGDFDDVIIRHGTDPALERLDEPLAKQCRAAYARLREFDRTRHLIVPRGWFTAFTMAPDERSAGGGHATGSSDSLPYRLENPPFNVPYLAKGRDMVGRAGLIEKIREQLCASGRGTAVGTVICQTAAFRGLGGLGKTQLAVEYAHRYRHAYPGGVIWLDADQDIDSQLVRLADHARWIAPQTEHHIKLDVARQRLRSHGGVLIIFDNLEDPAVIDRYLRDLEQSVHILVTSRADLVDFTPIDLAVLSPAESAELVRQAAGRTPDSDAERAALDGIAERLEGLPLALEIAGAYLRRRSAVSWQEYLRLLEADLPQAMRTRLSSHTRHEADLFATLQVSEQLLDEEPFLRPILDVLAWSGTAFMDKALLAELLDEPEDRLIGALALGVELKILTMPTAETERGKRYRLHRLVQEVRRARVPLDGRGEWGQNVCKRMAAWFSERRQDFKNLAEYEGELDHLDAWSKHAGAQNWPEHAMLLWLQAYPPFHRGDYRHSREWLELAHAALVPDEDPKLTANIRSDLGSIFSQLGQHQEALRLQEQALEIQRKVLGPEHPDTARSLNNVGFSYSKLGAHMRALDLQRQALAISTKVLGAEHSDTATYLNNVGLRHEMLGDRKLALDLVQRALEIRRKVLGPEHPDIATSWSNMGYLHAGRGDYTEAARCFELAYTICRESLSEHAELTIVALAGWARCLFRRGQKRKAHELVDRCLLSLPHDHRKYDDLAALRDELVPDGFRKKRRGKAGTGKGRKPPPGQETPKKPRSRG